MLNLEKRLLSSLEPFCKGRNEGLAYLLRDGGSVCVASSLLSRFPRLSDISILKTPGPEISMIPNRSNHEKPTQEELIAE